MKQSIEHAITVLKAGQGKMAQLSKCVGLNAGPIKDLFDFGQAHIEAIAKLELRIGRLEQKVSNLIGELNEN